MGKRGSAELGGSVMREEAKDIIEMLKRKAMTKDQLGEHFGMSVDQVDQIIEQQMDPTYQKFLELLEMMPDR